MDLVKDRLYCAAADSVERRGAQTVLYTLASAVIRSWATTLVHTCEEAWAALPGTSEDDSVHLVDWPQAGDTDEALGAWVESLRAIRTEIEKKADPLRKQKLVGGGQDLRVQLHATGELADALVAAAATHLGDDREEGLLEILGVASIEVLDAALEATDHQDLTLTVAPSELPRCDRCRRRRPSVQGDEGAALCARCEPWREATTA